MKNVLLALVMLCSLGALAAPVQADNYLFTIGQLVQLDSAYSHDIGFYSEADDVDLVMVHLNANQTYVEDSWEGPYSQYSSNIENFAGRVESDALHDGYQGLFVDEPFGYMTPTSSDMIGYTLENIELIVDLYIDYPGTEDDVFRVRMNFYSSN